MTRCAKMVSVRKDPYNDDKAKMTKGSKGTIFPDPKLTLKLFMPLFSPLNHPYSRSVHWSRKRRNENMMSKRPEALNRFTCEIRGIRGQIGQILLRTHPEGDQHNVQTPLRGRLALGAVHADNVKDAFLEKCEHGGGNAGCSFR